MTLARRTTAEAEPDLRRAAELFGDAHSPMDLVARYYAATARYELNDLAGARRELERLRDEAQSTPHYIAHGAQVGWELGLCAVMDEDWTSAAALFTEAADRFRRLGETSNLAFMQGMLATSFISLGKPDQGWALRSEAFAAQSAEGRADRLPVSIADAARVELRMGHLEPARALLDIEESAHRAAGDDAQISNALVRESMIDTILGDAASADRHVHDASAAAHRIRDPGLRARAEADASFAAGAAALQVNPIRARELLTRAIDHYRVTEKAFYLPEALLWRARAARRLGATGDALRDLDEGIDEAERHRNILDARRTLFDEAIALRLDNNDLAGAFAGAERAHDAAGSAIATLQHKLAASDTVLLELFVLPHEIAAFCITERDAAVARHAITGEIAREDDGALFELLIRPSQQTMRGARHLIVVPDPPLREIAFAALFNSRTKRHLIEDMSVALAPNAGSLDRAMTHDAQSLVAVALPSGDENDTVALGEEAAELNDITHLYRRAVAIDSTRASLSAIGTAATNATVIHIAGHTERTMAEGDRALLFRGERVTWTRIAGMRLGRPVVVLAACETLVPASSPRESLAGGFLAAGATDVIATLAPVADNEARDFFRAVHRELAGGRDAAAALQRAQIEAIAADPNGRHPVWRAVAVLTQRIGPVAGRRTS
jgi:hypothetical protein